MAAPSTPSFIPKQPASGKVKQRKTRKIYILAYVSFVFFFGTLIAAAGTFFYEYSIRSQLEIEKQQLAELRNQFNQADFERVKSLHQQLSAAKSLLNQHVSVFSLIEALELSTLVNIQFESFTVERAVPDKITLSVDAATDNFNSVLFQREVYESNPVLSDIEMSEFQSSSVIKDKENPDSVKERVVTFVLNADLTKEDIGYVPRNSIQVRAQERDEAATVIGEVGDEIDTVDTVEEEVVTDTIE